jgi:hypothetical protein
VYLNCGFMGHGFMMAPIVGQLYAEWLTGGPKHEIFERCTLQRFATTSRASPTWPCEATVAPWPHSSPPCTGSQPSYVIELVHEDPVVWHDAFQAQL